jgi:Fic family protein
MLINTISLQEAKASSEIENIFTTDDELYKEFSDQKNEKQGAAKEILRYREALWKGHQYLNEKTIFDVPYFIQMFQEIKQTSDEIRPDFIHTTIKQGGSGANSGKVIYTPPKGVSVINEKLNNLISYLNDDKQFKTDHLLKMAIAHYQFEAIHPFRDGNGRTGRVFNIHYLTNKGLLDFPILFLSRFILNNKDDYYAGLNGVTQRGDWENWMMFMLKAIESTSNYTFDRINEIMSAKDSILEYVKKEAPKIRKPDELIQAIFTQPFTKVKHLQDAKIYSEATARDYLNLLTSLRILERKTIDGHHYYLNIELYRILQY